MYCSCGAASGVDARRTLCCAAAARRSVFQGLHILAQTFTCFTDALLVQQTRTPCCSCCACRLSHKRLESFSSRLESLSLRVPLVTHKSLISLLWMSISFCNLSFCARVHVLGTPTSAHGEVLRLGHLNPTEAVGSRAYICVYIIYKSGAYIYIYIYTYTHTHTYIHTCAS